MLYFEYIFERNAHILSKQGQYESLTKLLSWSRVQANNLPLMLRVENTETSFGFTICFSVTKTGIVKQ